MVFGEGEEDVHVVFGGGCTEALQLGRGEGDGVFGVGCLEGEVDWARPGLVVSYV